MNKKFFTEAELAEIEELMNDKAVQAAKKEQQEIYRERQKLYQLRWLKKRGEELLKANALAE